MVDDRQEKNGEYILTGRPGPPAVSVISDVIIHAMQTKLRKIGNGYGVLLPTRVIESLRLNEGDVLNLTETGSGIELSPFDADFSEQVEAFRRTEARHRNSYRELAK